MPMQPTPALPHLILPDPGTDLFGVGLTILTLLIAILSSSKKAQETAQSILSIYNFMRKLRDKSPADKPPTPAAPTNGNGHSNGNGNGGASDLLKSVMQNLRVESDARESGDLSIAQRLDSLSERGRRDSDNFYMLYSELSRDSKKHSEDIMLLKAEGARVQAQMVTMIKEQATTNERLEAILHILQPTPTPPGAVIPLDDHDDLEAVG